jgi:hypothetical protein
MGLSRYALCLSRAPFHGIVPSATVNLIGQITLPITFRTRENFCTEYVQSEVADFETAYNTLLRQATLTKFMVILHYAYMVLKMSGLYGVIPMRGDLKRAYDYDKERCEVLLDSIRASELDQATIHKT